MGDVAEGIWDPQTIPSMKRQLSTRPDHPDCTQELAATTMDSRATVRTNMRDHITVIGKIGTYIKWDSMSFGFHHV